MPIKGAAQGNMWTPAAGSDVEIVFDGIIQGTVPFYLVGTCYLMGKSTTVIK